MGKILTTVGQSTFQTIKEDIIFGNLKPGLKLKLGVLKDQYSASVSILRETLNRLASEGFVEAKDQRGFYVATTSKEDFLEIANLRILLECYALELSIKNGDSEWEGNLVSAHHKLSLAEKEIQTNHYYEKNIWKKCDHDFHRALIHACDSKNLLSLHSTLYDKYFRYEMLLLTFQGKEDTEHQDMLNAALNRDVKLAQKLLKNHIQSAEEYLIQAY
jgi:DNA-binding GntR family transcriptional regulator